MGDIFRRIEKKYIVSEEQYKKIKEKMKENMVEDKFGKSTICNIYFDTEGYDLISHSITKPYFKEKVRLRSYNIPNEESKVYLEIKRKYDGVVGKRRIEMKLSEFKAYMENKDSLEVSNKQIKTELDYYFKIYDLKPAMYISYEREAYYQKGNEDFRLTFDSKILARNEDMNLEKGCYGENILGNQKYIMEVKTLGAIPMWFVEILDECKVVPGSFSKYGEAYTKFILKPNEAYLRNLAKQAEAMKARFYALKTCAV